MNWGLSVTSLNLNWLKAKRKTGREKEEGNGGGGGEREGGVEKGGGEQGKEKKCCWYSEMKSVGSGTAGFRVSRGSGLLTALVDGGFFSPAGAQSWNYMPILGPVASVAGKTARSITTPPLELGF